MVSALAAELTTAAMSKAQHGAEWPEEGPVLPRRRARAARRRRGRVNPTGTTCQRCWTGSSSALPSRSLPFQLRCFRSGFLSGSLNRARLSKLLSKPRPEVVSYSGQDSVEVVKNVPQERISERGEAIEVPKTSRQRSVEAVKSISQERGVNRARSPK